MAEQQVFQTNSETRWRRFKWGSRALLLLIPVSIVAFTIGYIFLYMPTMPSFKDAKKIVNQQQGILSKNSLLASKYKGFRQYIIQKDLTIKGPYKTKTPPGFRDIFNTNMPAGVRAAFYVNWNSQSFTSLQRNINKLNMVIPEWIFIN